METSKKLSPRRQQILGFIQEFITENGIPPTVRDIQRACQISSTSVVEVLAIELVTPISVVEVARLQRPLRDAVFTELHSIYALRYVQEKGFDHPFVRERLIRASGRVVGLGTVKAILVRKIGTQVPLRR